MINQRSKWFDEQKPNDGGDLVFVVDGNNRWFWRRGIVVTVKKGWDGRIRMADVKTADGKVQRRGVVNLAALDIR